jgi:peroxiredoxin Q/BCP
MSRITTIALAVAAAAATLTTASAADRPQVGDPAPGFSLTASDGTRHDLAELRGEQAVVLVFFRGVW